MWSKWTVHSAAVGVRVQFAGVGTTVVLTPNDTPDGTSDGAVVMAMAPGTH